MPDASSHIHIADLAHTWLWSSGRLVTASKEWDATCTNSRASPTSDTLNPGLHLPVGCWPPGQGPPAPSDRRAGSPGDVEVGAAVEVTQLHVPGAVIRGTTARGPPSTSTETEVLGPCPGQGQTGHQALC